MSAAEGGGERRVARAAAVAAIACFGFAGVFSLYDFDLGLARATGRFIVEQLDVPRTNVFSALHHDRPFVDDKWLFHVAAYVLVDLVGPAAAIAARVLALLGLGLLVVPWRRAPAFGALLGLVALLAAQERFAFRPELFTLPAVALFCRVLLREAPPSRREIALLAAVQAVWANVHGYFVLGPILAAASAVGAAADALARRESRAGLSRRAWLVPALALACLVNPYGLALAASPLEILRDLRANRDVYAATIEEFAPTFGAFDVLPSDLIAYRVLLCAVAAALVLGFRALRARDLAPLLALFLMSLEIRRNVAPFAVAAAPWAALVLARTWPRARAARGLAASSALVFAAAFVWLHAGDHAAVHDRLEKRFGLGVSPTAFPDEEIDFVLRELPAAPLLNSFSFGSTFTGRAWPERAPFIDGNTAGYPVEFLREYADFVTGRREAKALVDRYGIEQCLLKPGHPVVKDLLELGFAPVHLGRQALVLVRGERHRDVVRRFDLRRPEHWARVEVRPRTPTATAWRAREPRRERNAAFTALLLFGYEGAKPWLDAAVAVNPSLFEARWERGVARLGAGEVEEAVADLRAAAELAPGSLAVRADLGLALWRAGSFADARDVLQGVVAKGAGAGGSTTAAVPLFRLGLAHHGLGDLGAATECMRRALAAEPDFRPAREWLERFGGGR